MKRPNLKKWTQKMGMNFLIVAVFSWSSALYAASANCVAEKAEFKKIYLELQAKYLNYEGKDTTLDSKGNIKLVPHDPSKPYEGKEFEAAIFHEYQNSLKKVAKLYQAAKFGNDSQELKGSTPGLVDFLKAIDDGDNSAYIQKTKINDVIEDLYKASNARFKGDKKFALTENDKYLLKKLLTHAQDRVCSVETYEKTGKGTKLFDANYLNQVRNAPLNRLIGAIKNAKIGQDSELLVDEKTAIASAMAEHVNQLAKWMKKNEACRKAISNPAFIQANVQGCNYNKFLDVLNQQNLNELEAVLHFINANERLLNRGQAKAETALDELKLESVIDSTFSNMGNAVNCTKIDGPNNKQRIFVRNLPYSNNQFDTSKIICKLKDKELKSSECSQKLELVSDELGRGIEIKQKGKTAAPLTFSISGNTNCENLSPSNETLSETKTPEACIAEGKKLTPSKFLLPSEDKKSCVDPVTLTPKTPEICYAEGQNKSPAMFLFPSEDKKTCVDPTTIAVKTPELCKAIGENDTPKKILIPSIDKKSCVDPSLLSVKTPEACQAEGEALNPKKILIPSEDKKSCVEDPASLLTKTPEACQAEGEALNPKKILIPSEDKKSCVEDPASLLTKTPEACKAEGEALNPKKILIPSEDKKSCVEDPSSLVKTPEACKAEGEALNPKKILIPSEDKKSCVEDPSSLVKTPEVCKAEGEALNPKKILVPSEDKKSCVENPADEKSDAASCEQKNKKWIDEVNNGVPGTKYQWNADKKSCDEVSKSSDEAKCQEKNTQWIQDSNDGRPGIRYEWDGEKKSCVDKRPDQPSKKEKAERPESASESTGPEKVAPTRFVPVNIPTRQMYILPGMP